MREIELVMSEEEAEELAFYLQRAREHSAGRDVEWIDALLQMLDDVNPKL